MTQVRLEWQDTCEGFVSREIQRRTSAFAYKEGELFCDFVSAREIAEKVGTPTYVYLARAILERYREFDDAFGKYPHLICYSVKANSNLGILRLLAKRNAGFDIVSAGELYKVLEAGGRASRAVFSGVGKTAAEMDYALKAGVLLFNCESESELRLLNERAMRLKKKARVGLRVNPHVDATTHPYIHTGLTEHKFGVEMEAAEDLYRRAREWPGLRMTGLSCHIGSQIADLAPFAEALGKLVALAARLRKTGMEIEYLDAGGGLAVGYRQEESPPSIGEYCKELVNCLRGSGLKLVVEPGRALVAEAGILLTRVVHVKSTGKKRFVIVDAAMNDLIRPSLYGAYHEVRPVICDSREPIIADLVGPVCETGDFLARARLMPDVEPGDLLAIFTAGAYGYVLSSNYNARPRPAEVLVEGRRWRVARKRETWRDLVRGEAPA
jgi:diaminopimelate decarboxylase